MDCNAAGPRIRCRPGVKHLLEHFTEKWIRFSKKEMLRIVYSQTESVRAFATGASRGRAKGGLLACTADRPRFNTSASNVIRIVYFASARLNNPLISNAQLIIRAIAARP
jgi:hypothetical protein